MKDYILETCVDSVESAMAAARVVRIDWSFAAI